MTSGEANQKATAVAKMRCWCFQISCHSQSVWAAVTKHGRLGGLSDISHSSGGCEVQGVGRFHVW